MSNTSVDPYNDILLDGWHFRPTKDSLAQFAAIDRLAPKITVGDYSLDSNELLSAWILSDLTGGHGVADLKEGVDDNRYRMGTIYTRYPNQWVKPYDLRRSDIGTGAVFPLGEMYDYANSKYMYFAASGTDLFKDNVDTTSNLTGAPSGKGVAFRGAGSDTFFYIPMGNNGYATYEPDGPTFTNNNGVSAPDFQAFCLWDNKLIGIDNAGQLYYATSAAAATTWTSYGSDGKLDRSIEPKSLHVYYNRAGDPAVHVVTDSGVWVFDAATPRLYQIPDFESQNPYFGVAAAVWRGNLYVAAGLDILEYNGNVVRNIGLSRDDSLPYLFSGYVRDLSPSQNSLHALVRGVTVSSSSRTSVHEFSGFGWHCIFYRDSTSYVAYRMFASKADNKYRLYWGGSAGGVQYYQSLPQNFTNPREDINGNVLNTFFGDYTQDTGLFPDPLTGFDVQSTQTYWLETGRFDANMKGYRKIANAVEVNVSAKTAYETITIKYRTDNNTSWTTLGTCSTGYNVLQFGTLTSDNIYPGVAFESIEFRVEILDNIPSPYIQSGTVVIDSMVFSFLKVQNPSIAYTLDLDLMETYHDKSPEEMFDKLVALRTDDRFYALKHRDDTYRVRIAGMRGAEQYGLSDKRGIYSLSIVEVPTRLGLAP